MPTHLRKEIPPGREESVDIAVGRAILHGDLAAPAGARGLVIFAHGSGSSRQSPRNRAVAEHLRKEGLATLLVDLLTDEEEAQGSSKFDLALMTRRLEAATTWVAAHEATATLPIGYFGASTGAAVALLAAAWIGDTIRAVVCRGGRPDLVGNALAAVGAPTLLIVGALDEGVLELNRKAYEELGCATKELAVVPGATHLFEEEGALEEVARRAAPWFRKHLLTVEDRMHFKNRTQAACLLAERLKSYRGKNPLILAIPRGAVPMGKVLAAALGGELDVVLVRKLGAPENPEYAIGSIGEDGSVFLGEHARSYERSYLEEEKAAQLALLSERRKKYTAVRPPIDPTGRIVIVVDDGLATGATMIAALRALRGRKPKRLIAAAAVSSPQAAESISSLADEMVYLHVPDELWAVGNYFEDFSAVSDEEVIDILREDHLAHSIRG